MGYDKSELAHRIMLVNLLNCRSGYRYGYFLNYYHRHILMPSSRCFYHSMDEPKPFHLATPHSCENSCSRLRESECSHPCPLQPQCHPKPCLPCQISNHHTSRMLCNHCPLEKGPSFPQRCGIDANARCDLSCRNICTRTLGCKKHSGECNKCEVRDMARCWCGEEKEI